MKKNFAFIMLFYFAFIALNSKAQTHIDTVVILLGGNATDTLLIECDAWIGEILEPEIDTFCSGINQQNELLPTFITYNNQDKEFAFIVTKDTDENVGARNEEIKTITKDGILDIDSLGLESGKYCFTAISYSQTELDIITNNINVQQALLNNCIFGGEDLLDLLLCIMQNTDLTTIDSAIDSLFSKIVPQVVPQFQSFISQIDQIQNPPPCYDLTPEGLEYCITFLGENDGCIVNANDYYNESFQITNFPNPFKSITTIKFFAKEGGNVDFKVYDLLG